MREYIQVGLSCNNRIACIIDPVVFDKEDKGAVIVATRIHLVATTNPFCNVFVCFAHYILFVAII